MRKIPTLINWPVYSLKIGLSSGLAVVLCTLLSVKDPISAAFIAAVCTSPTILTGLRRAFDQLVGSILGGAFATILMMLGLGGPVAVALSVGLAVIVCGWLSLDDATLVAAFTALYVVLLNPVMPQTYEMRVYAVVLGALAALCVTFLLSAMLYPVLFARRMRVARELSAMALCGEIPFDAVLGSLSALSVELQDASREIWSRQWRPLLADHRAEVEVLQRIVHFGKDASIRDGGRAIQGLERAALVLRRQGLDPLDDTPLGREIGRWLGLHPQAESPMRP